MKSLRIFDLIFFFLLLGLGASAQQEPQFSQNMFNHMTVNPGYAGLSNAICATGLMRQQWIGFTDAEGNRISPETFLMSVDATIPVLRGGIGGTVMQDKIGFFTTNIVKLGYSYHKKFPEATLGIGLQVGFNNTILDANKFLPVDSSDPLLDRLKGSELNNMMLDMSLGLFYQVPGRYYAGLSSSRILQNSKEIGEGTGANINFRRHYYLSAGYHFPLSGNSNFEVIPSLFIKSDGSTFQYDLNSLVVVNQKYWGGMSFRLQDAIVLMFGLSFNELRVGYSYDIPVSAVGASGSHEIMINYCFKIEVEKIRKSYRNTRFL
ncbi:MAG: type IX secretion system membrane protein PorP/SprF [Bacteroidales bacterium]|nr:type IX secretion system membrane protein PorP/SprF [Bacteroidales bacterium]MDZ4203516.1 type IX secretion system membrane protein PorP/SprF [Bacteroidales bacterium]